MTDVSVVIGPQTILSYKRLSYRLHYAIAEIIDNSVSSYLLHKDELSALAGPLDDKPLQVKIVYDKDNRILRISDNAMGMDVDELRHAMTIAEPPKSTSARHEFGMGLKTSACWMGDVWEVTTSKLGNDTEYRVIFDVERVASGDLSLPIYESKADPNSHYTSVEIQGTRQKIGGRLKGATLTNLRSIYRLDTRDFLSLTWGEQELTYDDSLPILLASDGSPHRRNFEMEVGGKRVTGWLGVLERGGRQVAGLAQIRRGRVVRGQPDGWKPVGLFGATENANNLVSQRLIGEVHFGDDFAISHTKDQILFEGDDEAVLIDQLAEEFVDFSTTANKNRKGGGGGPPKVAEDSAVSMVRDLIESTQLRDRVVTDPVPDPKLIEASKKHVLDETLDGAPHQVWKIDDLTVKVYLSTDLSPMDPYYVGEFPGNGIICIIVNKEHPFWQQHLHDVQDIVIYLLMATFDSIAEYKLMSRQSEITADSVRGIKDSFMRVQLE